MKIAEAIYTPLKKSILTCSDNILQLLKFFIHRKIAEIS